MGMPSQVCPKCGKRISYSKADKFEKIHKCYPKFADRIKTKPVINIETKSDESEQETSEQISDIGTDSPADQSAKRKTKNLQNRNKFSW